MPRYNTASTRASSTKRRRADEVEWIFKYEPDMDAMVAALASLLGITLAPLAPIPTPPTPPPPRPPARRSRTRRHSDDRRAA